METFSLPPFTRTDPAETAWRLASGEVVVMRAARTEDGPLMQALVHRLSMLSRYRRFFYPLHELPPGMLTRFSHADPRHEMSLLVTLWRDGREIAIGMAQYVADLDAGACEFALVVDDAWQRKGIAARMLRALCAIARDAGLRSIQGDLLADNQPMLQLLTRLGFTIGAHEDGGYLRRARQSLEPDQPAILPAAPVRQLNAAG